MTIRMARLSPERVRELERISAKNKTNRAVQMLIESGAMGFHLPDEQSTGTRIGFALYSVLDAAIVQDVVLEMLSEWNMHDESKWLRERWGKREVESGRMVTKGGE